MSLRAVYMGDIPGNGVTLTHVRITYTPRIMAVSAQPRAYPYATLNVSTTKTSCRTDPPHDLESSNITNLARRKYRTILAPL